MKRFLVITGCLSFLCLVTLVSYLVTLRVTGQMNPVGSTLETETGGQESEPEVTGEGEEKESEIEKPEETYRVTLIYGHQKATGKITALILEVWDGEKGSLDYVTVPEDTLYMLSKELYQRLTVQEPELSQIVKLSHLYQYCEEEHAFEQGVQILEEMLRIDIDGYQVLKEKKLLKQFFRNEEDCWQLTADTDAGYHRIPGEEKNAGVEIDAPEMYTELTGILRFRSGERLFNKTEE